MQVTAHGSRHRLLIHYSGQRYLWFLQLQLKEDEFCFELSLVLLCALSSSFTFHLHCNGEITLMLRGMSWRRCRLNLFFICRVLLSCAPVFLSLSEYKAARRHLTIKITCCLPINRLSCSSSDYLTSGWPFVINSRGNIWLHIEHAAQGHISVV